MLSRRHRIGRCDAETWDARSSRTKRLVNAVFSVTSQPVDGHLVSKLRCCILKDKPAIGPDAFWTAERSPEGFSRRFFASRRRG